MTSRPKTTLYNRLTPGGERNFADDLRAENTGAVLLLLGAVVALVWVNSPWSASYLALGDIVIGPSALHLDLSVAQWATDGLLAIFFFVVGLELKREMVDGQLRRPSTAIVPILAAVGGMAAPAAIYALINTFSDGGSMDGWAVPVATDIAFAVAVLTVFGKRLPTALRAFLLTLAVVDDLLGIVVIAVFYADGLQFAWLAASFATIGVFAVLVRRRGMTAWILVPLAVAAWGFMHASGVHATIAGVILGFTVPALARAGESVSIAEHLEHLWRPVSAGLAVPVFALFAAGVSLSPEDLASTAGDPAAQGVALGLVLGKPIGILIATFLLVKLTGANLDPSVRWPDLFAVSVVAGVGFTVSLLIGELSFAETSPHSEHVKAAVLIGSLTSAAIGGALLTWRTRIHLARPAEPVELTTVV
ncbi:Na+/H+ antiporter NhaA [Pengzhenrongella frigida]|uniref:Na(+)/H(+) antiporter NhaA n=1 Tax=Pengzhenrongella frigida TaxID=1259133 RepID=A0A4Q5MXN9_9MICO|nr:Na+/H+ antiporter NhaA [Cellulomonas sp. HLT2-17]RYV49713.1 Na+/H+ antiporter NhaA [Cellulomonas sp. HLT2-17]